MTRKRDAAGNEYIYLKGLTAIAAGSWVTYDEVGVTALIDADAAATSSGGNFVAVAQAAVDASTSYGWFMIFGTCSALAATVVDNTEVFAVSTAATGDDSGTGGMQIIGAMWRSADSGGAATVQLQYPFLGANVA
jgi:hypothetical protein